MKISFVIPAYNEEKRLPQCIESIQRELTTGHYDAEIIVVNNASTDKTVIVAKSFVGVRVVDEMKKGLMQARQTGYVASVGDLVANVDADTMLTPGWVKKVLDEFTHDPALLALSGPFIYYDLPFYARWYTNIFYAIGLCIDSLHKIFIGGGSMLQGGNYIIRRTALDQIGGYNLAVSFYGEDIDTGRRIGKVGKIKWTFGLPMYSSGRRLQKEGIITTGFRYALTFFAITFTGKSVINDHVDVRPE